MIDEQLAKRIENMETVIASLSARVAALEGNPEETPEKLKARERDAYEKRMNAGGIPQAFWREAQ